MRIWLYMRGKLHSPDPSGGSSPWDQAVVKFRELDTFACNLRGRKEHFCPKRRRKFDLSTLHEWVVTEFGLRAASASGEEQPHSQMHHGPRRHDKIMNRLWLNSGDSKTDWAESWTRMFQFWPRISLEIHHAVSSNFTQNTNNTQSLPSSKKKNSACLLTLLTIFVTFFNKTNHET